MGIAFDNIEHVRSRPSGLEIGQSRPTIGDRRAWRGWAVEVSAIPDVLYPFDPAVLRAVHREFDPHVLPVIVRRVFRSSTGGFRVARFHALARRHRDFELTPAPWTYRVMMPLRGRQQSPTVMIMHLEDRTTRLGDGLPGSYLPFNWRVYGALRGLYQTLSTTEKKQLIHQKGRAAQARKKRIAADEMVRRRQRDDAAWLKQKVETIRNDEHIVRRLIHQQMNTEKTPMSGPWEGAR